MQCLNVARVSRSSPFSRWIISRSSSSKLFIGGLSYDTNETILKEAFKQHGEIIEGNAGYMSVKVICGHVSGKSKGYGFVHFTNENAASNALKEMDGKLLDGRNIRVQYAQNR